MTPGIALRLGRVSNLPTVWSNALAGALLAGGTVRAAWWLPTAIGISLLYIAGMFLNDAFDAAADARARPERPIPAGEVTRRDVFAWGFTILAAGWACATSGGALAEHGLATGIAAAALAGLILLYDWHHKGSRFGPLLMALCRVGAYAVAGFAASARPGPPLFAGALVLTAHLAALTYIAKHEFAFRWRTVWPLVLLAMPLVYPLRHAVDAVTFALMLALVIADGIALGALRRRAPGDAPRAVMTLIAAISLVDALLIAGAGRPLEALAAAAGFPLTLAAQRLVRGT